MRFDMRKVLLNEFLDNRDFSTEVKTALRGIFNDHTSYRAGQHQSDRGSWPPSALQTFRFFEESLYTKDRDSCYRAALRSKKSASEVLEMERFEEAIQQIDDALESEAQAVVGPYPACDEQPSDEEDGAPSTDDIMGVYVPKPEELSADNRDALERWRGKVCNM